MAPPAVLVDRTPRLRDGLTSSWTGRAFWAVLDQGLFAASNFVLALLLARLLEPAAFGAFAIVYSAFLFWGVVHTSVLTEPLLVFGGSRFAGSFREYFRQLLAGHAAISIVAGVTLVLVGLAVGALGLGHHELVVAFISFGIACPFILLNWLVRRACFAALRPHLAAGSGAIYVVAMTAGIVVCWHFAALSPGTAAAVMGAASGLSVLPVIFWVRRPAQATGTLLERREVLNSHWNYGRWALATSVVSWLIGNGFNFVLPAAGGLAATASFRALFNLFMPVMHALGALGMVLIPAFARERGTPRFRGMVQRSMLGLAAVAAAYGVLLVIAGDTLVNWVYAGRYNDHTNLIALFAVLPITAAVSGAVGSAVRAMERPDLVFSAYLIAGAMGLITGVPLTLKWGVAGAILGMVIGSATTMTALIVAFRRLTRPEALHVGIRLAGAEPVRP